MSLSPAQLAARSEALGGSDCAVVLGLSRWKTARQLFHEKRHEVALDDEDTEERWFGRAVEPVVRQWYAEKTNRVVMQPTGTLVHPDFPWMVAHIDGFSTQDNETRGYEGKTAMRSIGWGLEGTDQIPLDAFFQCQHYAIVTHIPVWDVVCLIGRRFASYEVRADAELQGQIIEAEREFMRRVVENDPPALEYEHRTALDLLKRVYPGTNGQSMDAPTDALHWRAEMLEAVALEGEAKRTKEAYKARLLAAMGDHALMVFPDGKVLRRQRITRPAYTVAESAYMDIRLINAPRGRKPRGARP